MINFMYRKNVTFDSGIATHVLTIDPDSEKLKRIKTKFENMYKLKITYATENKKYKKK